MLLYFTDFITDGNSEMTEMAEAMRHLDNKIADLESENEALKEERLILREKVRVNIRFIHRSFLSSASS